MRILASMGAHTPKVEPTQMDVRVIPSAGERTPRPRFWVAIGLPFVCACVGFVVTLVSVKESAGVIFIGEAGYREEIHKVSAAGLLGGASGGSSARSSAGSFATSNRTERAGRLGVASCCGDVRIGEHGDAHPIRVEP